MRGSYNYTAAHKIVISAHELMIITHVYEVFRSRLIQTKHVYLRFKQQKKKYNSIKDTLMEKNKKAKAKKVVNTYAYILHKYQIYTHFNTRV